MISSASTQEQEKYVKAGAIAEEVLGCIRTVVAFGGQKRESKKYLTRSVFFSVLIIFWNFRYDDELKASEKLGIKKAFYTGGGMAFVFMLLYGTYALAFWQVHSLYFLRLF